MTSFMLQFSASKSSQSAFKRSMVNVNSCVRASLSIQSFPDKGGSSEWLASLPASKSVAGEAAPCCKDLTCRPRCKRLPGAKHAASSNAASKRRACGSSVRVCCLTNPSSSRKRSACSMDSATCASSSETWASNASCVADDSAEAAASLASASSLRLPSDSKATSNRATCPASSSACTSEVCSASPISSRLACICETSAACSSSAEALTFSRASTSPLMTSTCSLKSEFSA
mmetsp:Transcript_2325/g.5870  ORF Transcript_2325/g.5870 Transcript_2325/m.5870 type:complete len:231 (+) Transcript_2325:820-1512(+)